MKNKPIRVINRKRKLIKKNKLRILETIGHENELLLLGVITLGKL